MEESKPRLLIADDEPPARRGLASVLAKEGFSVARADGAAACRVRLATGRFDLVLLDLDLADADALALVADIRAASEVGLVIVTSLADPVSKIAALDHGADDYLVKPAHPGELAARIRSVLRRRSVARRRAWRVGAWRLDPAARTVIFEGRRAGLTRGEFDLLTQLVAAQGAVVPREALLSAVSRRPQEAESRSVDVLVSRLRRKLARAEGGAGLIVTSPGHGYRLARTPQPG